MKKNLKILWFAVLAVGIGTILFFTFYDYLMGNEDDGFGRAQQIGVLIGFSLVLIAGNHFYRFLLNAFFVLWSMIGMILLSLNIYGEFVSLRSPRVYEGTKIRGMDRVPEVYNGNGQDQLERMPNETYQDYAYRLTERVFDLTIHLWDYSVDYREYNHQIPLHENYLLWLLSYTEPNSYLYYELCDPYKAIERGVIICSQSTKALVSLWKSQTGLPAKDIVLDGHVVAQVQVDPDADVWWLLDADYGIVLEHDISTLEGQPELVIDGYLSAGYNQKIAETLADIYGQDGNYVASNTGICARERRLYKAKWSIPLGLLGISMLYFGGEWIVRERLSKGLPR